jgi:hypothetical protein
MLMAAWDYAAHRGVAFPVVQRAIAAGRIKLSEDNLIDTEVADREWTANTDQSKIRKPPAVAGSPGGPPSEIKGRPTEAVPGIAYADARALREVCDVQRRQLELAVRRGELVRRDEVEAESFRAYRMLRDAVLNLPARLAAQLAAESDEDRVHALLEAEVKRIFTEFAEGQRT